MKKAIKIVVLILIALILPLYYYMRMPFDSGIYPIRQAGLLVLPVDNDMVTGYSDFKIPIVWIKANPFSSDYIEYDDIKLYDREGHMISEINGGVKPVIEEQQWYKREAYGSIYMTLNSIEQVGKKSSLTNAIKDKQDNIILSKVVLKKGGKTYNFNLGNKEKVILLRKDRFSTNTLSNHGEKADIVSKKETYVKSNFTTNENATLQEVMFYLPGMEDTYLESNITYKGEGKSGFTKVKVGDSLVASKMEFRIGISSKVLNEVNSSVCIINPYFRIRNDKGEETILGLKENHIIDISNPSKDFKANIDRFIVEPEREKWNKKD